MKGRRSRRRGLCLRGRSLSKEGPERLRGREGGRGEEGEKLRQVMGGRDEVTLRRSERDLWPVRRGS